MVSTSKIDRSASRSELRLVVRNQLRSLLDQKNYDGAKILLGPVQAVDIAEAIEGLAMPLQVIAFRLLNKEEAIAVYEYLPTEIQQTLIEEFRTQEVNDIVNSMAPDDRAKLFDELPSTVVRRILSQLSAEERQATSLLLGYQPDTAGRVMTPEYISVRSTLTVTEAQERIRQRARDTELSYYVYVTGESKRLMGTVSLRDLILAEPDQPVGDIMTQNVVFATTDTDQEDVAHLIQRYDLIALPIVDHEQSLLGVVTVDDVIDIIQQEATEDIYTMGGINHDEEDTYFDASLLGVARKRIPWLLILLITNTMTVFIMSNYEYVLDEVVALAFFTPLLIDAGGNVGAQSSTVVIRGLSTDELRHRTPLWVILRELISGSILGIVLGILVIALVLVFVGKLEIGLTVAISLFAIAAIAATVGAGLPYFFHKLGFDPALMSSPFITTVVDILGILIYLNIAKVLLDL